MHDYSDGLSRVGASLRPPSFSPHCCADQVADALEALASEFEGEAKHGHPTAKGLSVAAMVLRDRAAEALNGYLDVPAAS